MPVLLPGPWTPPYGLSARPSHSRPRRQVLPLLRYCLCIRRDSGDPHAAQGAECERLRRALDRDASRRVPGLAADPRPPASRSHPSDLCAPLQPATPASGTGARGTRASRSRRRGRPCARHRTARSPRRARARVQEGGMIEFSYPTALLRLLDCPFDFLCPSCIELLFIWSQLVEESQELSRVTEFFTGDVHKHRDGELVVR